MHVQDKGGEKGDKLSSKCKCLANSGENEAFCESGKFVDPDSCNANKGRCHWGPGEDPACTVDSKGAASSTNGADRTMLSVAIVIATAVIIIVGVVLVLYKTMAKKKEQDPQPTNANPPAVAIPMVGDLTAPLVYSHALTDYCSRAVLGSESNISTFI